MVVFFCPWKTFIKREGKGKGRRRKEGRTGGREREQNMETLQAHKCTSLFSSGNTHAAVQVSACMYRYAGLSPRI